MGNPVLDSGAGFTSLPNLLPGSYVSGLFGKWHLGGVSDAATPTDHGWDRHIGTLGGVLPDYYVWSVVDSATGYAGGAGRECGRHAVRHAAHCTDAAEWINANAADPWFATIAFNTPHDPFHVPPGIRCGNGRQSADDDYLFNLMVQNMDGNIGRLIGTSGQPGGRRYFPPIAADQLSNTIIVSSATTALRPAFRWKNLQDRNLRGRSTCADDHLPTAGR